MTEIQNINLLTALPPRQSIYFSFRVYQFGMLGLLAVLAGIYFIFFAANFLKENSIKKFTQKRTHIVLEIEKGTLAMQGEGNIDQTLQANIQDLKSKLQAKEKVLRLINIQEQIKFSALFELLANKIPNDLWLNKIHMIPNHNYMSMEGYTLNPSLVSFFFHQLTNNKLFENYKFSVVDIKETKENYYHFTAKTRQEMLPPTENNNELNHKKN